MRHTAITRLAENGVAIAIIKARAGHMTDRMSEHYTHISEQAHRLAVTPMHQRKSPVSTSNATPWLRTG
jgi:integrase